MTIAVIKIPGTNLRNVLTALPKDISVISLDHPEEIQTSTDINWIILPGVGHFQSYIQHLKMTGWFEYLLSDEFGQTGIKLLGICSGFHALCNQSEEAPSITGLGLLDLNVTEIKPDHGAQPPVKSPHTGRTSLINQLQHVDFPYVDEGFFTHSYGIVFANQDLVMQTVKIGNHSYIASVKHKNIYGVQHHPELTGDFGQKFFEKLFSRNNK